MEVTITIRASGAACYGRWCGGASSRSQSSLDARRIRSSSPNLSNSSGVTCTRGGFGAAGVGGSASMVVIVLFSAPQLQSFDWTTRDCCGLITAAQHRCGDSWKGILRMMKWILLAGAILSEVTGSLSMKAAIGHPGWYVVVAVGYATSFVFLDRVLRAGVPLGVAYAIWGCLLYTSRCV